MVWVFFRENPLKLSKTCPCPRIWFPMIIRMDKHISNSNNDLLEGLLSNIEDVQDLRIDSGTRVLNGIKDLNGIKNHSILNTLQIQGFMVLNGTTMQIGSNPRLKPKLLPMTMTNLFKKKNQLKNHKLKRNPSLNLNPKT